MGTRFDFAIMTGVSYVHGAIVGLISGGIATAFGYEFWPCFSGVAVTNGTLVMLNVVMNDNE